jgi:hypothetical protein
VATIVHALGVSVVPQLVVGLVQAVGVLLGTVGIIYAQGTFRASSVRLVGMSIDALPSWLIAGGGLWLAGLTMVETVSAVPVAQSLLTRFCSAGAAASVFAIVAGWRLWLQGAANALRW